MENGEFAATRPTIKTLSLHHSHEDSLGFLVSLDMSGLTICLEAEALPWLGL